MPDLEWPRIELPAHHALAAAVAGKSWVCRFALIFCTKCFTVLSLPLILVLSLVWGVLDSLDVNVLLLLGGFSCQTILGEEDVGEPKKIA